MTMPAGPMPPSLPSPLSGEAFDLDGPAGRIACYHAAPHDAERATPLLLVHSVNAAASAFEVRPLFDHYRATRPVYALDLPGYGRSDRGDRFYDPRLMTDAVHALADEIARRHGPGPIDAIGVSLSCEYVARAAVERPARYAAVCLVSATGLNRDKPFDAPPGTTRGLPWLLRFFERSRYSESLFRLLTRPAVIRFFLNKTWGSKDIDEGLFRYDVLTTRQPGASRAPFHFLSAYLFSADITRVYEALTMPVLLVHGTRGDFVDYRAADRLVREHAWHRHAMQTGAMPYFERLDEFVAKFDAFAERRP